MKKLYHFTALILMVPFLSFAQSNYRAGYVVTLKGDTVKGFIDYREWDASPDAVNFKRSLNDNDAVKYGPGDIRYFGVGTAETYRSYTGLISTDPTGLDQVAYKRDTSFRTGTVFLRTLVKGNRLALYMYKDELKQRFFLAGEPDFEPKELIFRLFFNPEYDYHYPTNPDGSKNLRTVAENIYKRQLSAAAVEYDELNENLIDFIAKSEYTAADITTIVGKINHMSKAEYRKKYYAGPALDFFVSAGLNVSTTTTSTGVPYETAGGTSYTSFLPMASVGINIFANPATRRLQFRVEASLAEAKYRSLFTDKVSPYEPTEFTYDVRSLQISPQVVYNFYNADKFKIFVAVGMVFIHFNYSNAYYGSQNHDNSVASIAANNPFWFNSGDNAFMIKGGIQFTRHLAIFVDYMSTTSPSQDTYYSLSAKCAQVGLY